MSEQKRIEFDTEYGPIVIYCEPDVNIELLGVQRVIAKIGDAPSPTRSQIVTVDRQFPLIDD